MSPTAFINSRFVSWRSPTRKASAEAAAKKEVEVTERVAANKKRIAEETEAARAEEKKKAEVIAQKLLMGEAHRKEKAKVLVRGRQWLLFRLLM